MKLDKRQSLNKAIEKNAGPYEAKVVNVLDPVYSGSIEVELLRSTDCLLYTSPSPRDDR